MNKEHEEFYKTKKIIQSLNYEGKKLLDLLFMHVIIAWSIQVVHVMIKQGKMHKPICSSYWKPPLHFTFNGNNKKAANPNIIFRSLETNFAEYREWYIHH